MYTQRVCMCHTHHTHIHVVNRSGKKWEQKFGKIVLCTALSIFNGRVWDDGDDDDDVDNNNMAGTNTMNHEHTLRIFDVKFPFEKLRIVLKV